MRVVADLPSADILQVEKDPVVGSSVPFNGRFSIPVPEGAAIDVTASSYVLPVDGGDVWSQAMQALLAQYPMYQYVVFNPLLTATDLADIDLAATGPSGNTPRLSMGRAVGPGVTGQAPNTTTILPINNRVAPPRPGLLVTDTIDIGPMTGGAGADEFFVWWKIYGFNSSEDVMSDFGATLGQNIPSFREIIEIDQEPGNFDVFITHDDGATWTQVTRMDPMDLIVFDTRVRLAFRSNRTDRVYLAGYAILF
jgi:hypothetical protein